jgi:hypothetical protein
MKRAVVFVAGLLAGVSLVVACGQGSHSNAATTSECTTWEVYPFVASELPQDPFTYSAGSGTRTDNANMLPSGWEPFAADASIWGRHCKQ